ncbi:hypothetical protein CsatA_000942 [Cannabis sativa]
MNPMLSLLTENKLNGSNFNKWNENINIALIGESALFVLTEPSPEVPGDNASKAVKEKYERWQKANDKALYFMLSSMVDTLKTRFSKTEKAAEVMTKLNELFGKASLQSRFDATKKYINARMEPHQNVRDHVLLMSSYFQEAQDHGAEMDSATQVSLILNSLTPAFLPCTSNYVMNKKEIDFHELVNDLQTYENLIGGPKKKGSKPHNPGNGNGTIKPEANVASASKPKSKRKWNNTKKRTKAMKNKRMLLLVMLHLKESVSTAMKKVIGNPNVLNFLQTNKAMLLELRRVGSASWTKGEIVQMKMKLFNFFELIVLV